MPERREYRAILLLLLLLIFLFTGGAVLTVLALWIDSTETEQERSKDPRAKAGLVHPIGPSSSHVRGKNKAQTSVYPPMWKKSKLQPDPPPISTLVFKSVKETGRALVMDFGSLYLHVRVHSCCMLCLLIPHNHSLPFLHIHPCSYIHGVFGRTQS